MPSTYLRAMRVPCSAIKVYWLFHQIAHQAVTPGSMSVCSSVAYAGLHRWPYSQKLCAAVTSTDRKVVFITEGTISHIIDFLACPSSTPTQMTLICWRVLGCFLIRRWEGAQILQVVYVWFACIPLCPCQLSNGVEYIIATLLVWTWLLFWLLASLVFVALVRPEPLRWITMSSQINFANTEQLVYGFDQHAGCYDCSSSPLLWGLWCNHIRSRKTVRSAVQCVVKKFFFQIMFSPVLISRS